MSIFEEVVQALIDLAKWLLDLVKAIFKAALDFLYDAFVYVVEQVLNAVLFLIGALPVPSFVAGNGFSQTLGSIPADVWYFASHLKFGQCFALLGAAFAFRLARKVATLFQW